MNHQDFSRTQARFLQRRYAISLGRRYVSTVAASVIILGLGGYSKLDSTNSVVARDLPQERLESLDYRHLEVSRIDPRVTAANKKFGFKLFSEILKQHSSTNSQNILISPTSVAIALAMAYNGAGGETQQVMAKTLELQGISLQEVNSANAALTTTLQNLDDIQLNIANSLWARQDYLLKPDFIQRNQGFYAAQIANLNFSDPNALATINNWVKQSTSGRSDRIVDRINSDEVLFLLNAIYFKGQWTNEFDKQKTRKYPFYLASGGQKQHPMMSQSGKYRYYENEKFQAVNLPYGNDGRLSLYVFLPRQNSNLSAFYQDLNAENWDKWVTQFSDRQGAIRLPRFKVESDFTLNDTLKALGMGVAFEEGANFSDMGENLALSEVKQKTFVEVSEEGTEAAATTSVGVELIAAKPQKQPFQMIVERPFFYAIRDNQTSTVLFMGSIQEPQ